MAEVDPATHETTAVYDGATIHIDAIGVDHGPVPALGYRVEVAGKTIVFAGDQNGPWGLPARDADLLVAHLAIAETTTGVAARLHRRPSEIAQLASQARVEHLVLSHVMRRSLDALDESLRTMTDRYRGEITVAQDLVCIEVR